MVALNLHRMCTESYINLTVGLQHKVPHNGCAFWFYSYDALWPPPRVGTRKQRFLIQKYSAMTMMYHTLTQPPFFLGISPLSEIFKTRRFGSRFCLRL